MCPAKCLDITGVGDTQEVAERDFTQKCAQKPQTLQLLSELTGAIARS